MKIIPTGLSASRLRTSTLFASALLAGALLGGCAKTAATMAPPANDETLKSIRQSLTSADPKALVGLVTAVLPDGQFASVGNVDPANFKVGDAVVFIDSAQKPIANGLVRAMTSDALNVEVMKPAADSRAPAVGDLAVRFAQ